MFRRFVLPGIFATSLTACTTGRLDYITPAGERKVACEVEYTWEPSVDFYAVEYTLSYCAKKLTEKGNTVVDKSLLDKSLEVVDPPKGKAWTFELAQQLHKDGKLTDKEYGYLVAYIDLGLANTK